MALKKTKEELLMKRLSNGKNLTISEARTRLGINSLSKRIYDLRVQGFPIYTNVVKTKNGRETAYRLDTARLSQFILDFIR